MALSTSLVAVWYSSDSSEVARAGLQFAEQPRILHRDDRLVGKGANQFDLPFGERLDPLPRQREHTNRLTLAQQRHAQRCPRLPEFSRLWQRVFRVCGDVGDVADLTFERGSLCHARAIWNQR